MLWEGIGIGAALLGRVDCVKVCGVASANGRGAAAVGFDADVGGAVAEADLDGVE